ncbi:hypothetical protein Tco_0922599 [Tanacetum coccineum]|uniref:Uncharacterized protein n=1 Tax=Tanacetum coccineum TaxID=301880 RepID=A0ABQ5CYJ9_9ASTR
MKVVRGGAYGSGVGVAMVCYGEEDGGSEWRGGPEEANNSTGTQDNIDSGNSEMEADPAQDYFVLPIYSSYTLTIKSSEAKNECEKSNKDIGLITNEEPADQEDQAFLEELERLKRQENVLSDVMQKFVAADIYENPSDGIFTSASYDDEGAVADFTNLETTVNISPILTLRIHFIHPTTQILGDPKSAVQTRSKVNKSSGAYAFISYIQKQRRNNHKDFQHCLFACFLSQIEPKKISEALEDESWVDTMQEELLQFKIQKILVFPKEVYKVEKLCMVYTKLPEAWPDIMFAVCACSRFQVTPKTSHLNVVKRIFRYLKGKPKMGLWYPRVSSFDLEAYSDSDYAGANLDRKSTTRGCQFLGRRLISWQCKKQTIVATSTTEAEYVAAANGCGQVLWIQNQMLDYGFYFMNTQIYIDNESTICIVKNPVFHSKTKHIEIRHHFIRDAYERKLI